MGGEGLETWPETDGQEKTWMGSREIEATELAGSSRIELTHTPSALDPSFPISV